MIQDIAPHTYHNEYKPSAPDKNSFILAFFQITNSRIYEIFGQPDHSIWHLQELQDISFSSGTTSAGSAVAVENQCCTAKKNV